MPNELRIDAAEGGCAKRRGLCAAASVRVGLSRIWKKKPGGTGKNITRTNAHRSGMELPSILHENQSLVQEIWQSRSGKEEGTGNTKRTEAEETTV